MTTDLPTISIVTPSLDQGEYLERTLASVLGQGYPALDYRVVDGGSTDGSVELIRAHADGLSWWVSEPDGGLADALNKGFAGSSGEIMGWINSSDAHFPWTLHTVVRVFRDLPEVDWILGLPSHLSASGELIDVWKPYYWSPLDLYAGKTLQQEGVFWRRRLWERAGSRVEPAVGWICDFELWLRFARHARAYLVPLPLGAFRFHADRRGADPALHYREDMQALAARARRSLPPSARRCAGIVARLDGEPGGAVRAAMARLAPDGPLALPRVRFDRPAGRWVVA